MFGLSSEVVVCYDSFFRQPHWFAMIAVHQRFASRTAEISNASSKECAQLCRKFSTVHDVKKKGRNKKTCLF